MSQIFFTAFSNEKIYNLLYKEAHNGAYIAYIRGLRCKTEDAFFREISASFQFPWYFGENWAAFDDCICDLEWLRFSSLFVVIDDYSQIFDNNANLQKILIKHLQYAAKYWDEEGIDFNILLNN